MGWKVLVDFPNIQVFGVSLWAAPVVSAPAVPWGHSPSSGPSCSPRTLGRAVAPIPSHPMPGVCAPAGEGGEGTPQVPSPALTWAEAAVNTPK